MKVHPLPTLLTIAALAAPGATQGIVPYLPKDTAVVFNVPDLDSAMTEFAKMPVAKMWAEEEVQKFLADLKEMAVAQINQGMAQAKEMRAQGTLPFDPEELTKLRLHGGTFALTKMEVGMGDFGPVPKLGMVLHLDFGASASTWNQLIETGLGMLMAQAGSQVTRLESKVGDVAIVTFLPKQAREVEMSLTIARVPNGILLGTLAEDVRAIVENMVGKKDVLAAEAAYRSAAQRVSPTAAGIQAYMRFLPMVDTALSLLRIAAGMSPEMAAVDVDGVERALAAVGWRDLGAMAMTSSYVDGKSVSRSFHGNDSVKTAAPTKTIDTSFLKWVPKDAVSFSAATMDLPGFYDLLVKGLNAYDSAIADAALTQLAAMEKQLGFSIRSDLFGALGDHYITWSMPMGSIASAPEMAVLIKVENETRLVGALKNLAKLSNGMVEIEQSEKRGLMVYQLVVNADPTEGMGGMNPFDMFQPTFAFKNGYLVMGFSASDVKRVFQRMDREDDPKGDIRGNKEYAAAATSIPAGIDSLSFTDWKALFESYYQLVTSLLAFIPMPEEVPLDMSLLPDSATLTQHLFGAISYSKTDARGTESVAVGPFGPELWLALGVVIGAGAAMLASVSQGF